MNTAMSKTRTTDSVFERHGRYIDMVHRVKKVSGWSLYTSKDGSMRFTSGNMFIGVHKSLGRYWVDYGLRDGHVIGTLRPAKTLKEAMQKVEDAKGEFVFMEKR